MRNFSLRLVLFLFLTALTVIRSYSQKQSLDDTLVAQQPIVDDKSPLAEVRQIQVLSGDSLVISDNKGDLLLFVKYKFDKAIGKKGKGPCEFETVSDFDIKGDIISVFDYSQARVIMYSLSGNKCIRELKNSKLVHLSSFASSDSSFYFTDGGYTNSTSDNAPLLYELKSNNQLSALKLQFSSLKKNFFKAPVRIKVPFKIKDQVAYSMYPMSQTLWKYDLSTDAISSFDVPLDLPKDTDFGAVNNMQRMIELIDHEIEFVSDIFLLNQHIAIVSRKGKIPNQVRTIRFYTYEGVYVNEIPSSDYIFHVAEDKYYRLKVDIDNPQSEHPYIVSVHRYVLPD